MCMLHLLQFTHLTGYRLPSLSPGPALNTSVKGFKPHLQPSKGSFTLSFGMLPKTLSTLKKLFNFQPQLIPTHLKPNDCFANCTSSHPVSTLLLILQVYLQTAVLPLQSSFCKVMYSSLPFKTADLANSLTDAFSSLLSSFCCEDGSIDKCPDELSQKLKGISASLIAIETF